MWLLPTILKHSYKIVLKPFTSASIMELLHLEFPSVVLSLSFLLLLLILITKRGFRPNSSNSLNLPPGPWKLPVIGSLHHLLTMMPHHAFHHLAKQYGPVMLVRLGQVDVVVVSSPEAASEIMKSQDLNFCTRPEIPVQKVMSYGNKDIVFGPYGDYWRQLRKICTVELLSPKRVKSFHSIFEEEITNLITDIYTSSSSGNPVNLSSMLGSLMNSIIGRCTFGRSRSEHHQELSSMLGEMLELISGFSVVDLFPNIKYIDVLSGTMSKVNRLHRHFDEIVGGIIKQHQLKKIEEVEDLVDVLLRIKDHGELEIPLTDDNLKAVVLDMFAAGTETSSTVLAWAMSELMKNPEMMEKATTEVRSVLKGKTKIEDSDLGELHYLNMIIKETLRLHPPGPLVPRQCMKSCQVGGYNIPVGTRVFVNIWALGRDSRYWDDAETFKPERFSGSNVDSKGTNFEFLPFGAGRRICPGMTFAAANLGSTLAQLLLNFNWELPNGMTPEELDMTESFSLSAARKIELCLLATPYSSSTL